jgi:deoxyribodipyrimidine photolyase
MASQSAPPSIVWFRDDPRLSDHPAPHAAASTGRPVKGAGVDLGKTYPEPIIDHSKGCEGALKAYAKGRAS